MWFGLLRIHRKVSLEQVQSFKIQICEKANCRNLVDRALELNRKRLVKKMVKLNANEKLQSKKNEMLNNFVEVALSRVTEQVATDLIKDASQEVSNVIQHKCDGKIKIFFDLNDIG